jgi:hypothetical protein
MQQGTKRVPAAAKSSLPVAVQQQASRTLLHVAAGNSGLAAMLLQHMVWCGVVHVCVMQSDVCTNSNVAQYKWLHVVCRVNLDRLCC